MEQLIADIDSRDFTIEGYDKIISNLNEISLICGEHVFFYNNRDIKVNGFTLNGTFFNKNGPFYRSDVVKVVELYTGVLDFCSVLLIEDISQENVSIRVGNILIKPALSSISLRLVIFILLFIITK
jgi:hypothetical protein